MSCDKIDLLTFIHVDNFILRKRMNYINGNIEIIKIKDINKLLTYLKSKINNLYFFTYCPNLLGIINNVILTNKCILTNSIDNIINLTNKNILLIGNEDYYNYTKIKNNNCIIININKYNLYYKDNDPAFDILDDTVNYLMDEYNKNNILNILETEKIYERYQMLKEDKHYFENNNYV